MNEIQNDLLYGVYEFLEPNDLARLTCVCNKFRSGHEQISHLIWEKYLRVRWGLNNQIMDKELKKLTSTEMMLVYPQSSPIIDGITSDHTDIVFDQNIFAADFLGRVGESNRSVQGTICFPSIKDVTKTRRNSFVEKMMCFANRMAKEFLRECDFPEFAMDDDQEMEGVRHSIPFAYYNVHYILSYYLKPRFISYYEVEIKPSKIPHSESATGFECVAVGLATKSFMKNKRLPGWDNESFGYHGDDGAIFHGQGRQLSEFGPRYGCNDTIGCGLNHLDSTIFFTLNGKMLGTAFEDIPRDVDLYPTVGIDSNCSVHFNFGKDRPFQFDLVQYIQCLEV